MELNKMIQDTLAYLEAHPEEIQVEISKGYKEGDIDLTWSANGIGFGHLAFYEEEGKIYCNNECMSKGFVKAVLCSLVEHSIFYSTSSKGATMKKRYKIQVTDEVEAETVLKAKCIFCRRMLTDCYKLQDVEVVEVTKEKEEGPSCQPEH